MNIFLIPPQSELKIYFTTLFKIRVWIKLIYAPCWMDVYIININSSRWSYICYCFSLKYSRKNNPIKSYICSVYKKKIILCYFAFKTQISLRFGFVCFLDINLCFKYIYNNQHRSVTLFTQLFFSRTFRCFWIYTWGSHIVGEGARTGALK